MTWRVRPHLFCFIPPSPRAPPFKDSPRSFIHLFIHSIPAFLIANFLSFALLCSALFCFDNLKIAKTGLYFHFFPTKSHGRRSLGRVCFYFSVRIESAASALEPKPTSFIRSFILPIPCFVLGIFPVAGSIQRKTSRIPTDTSIFDVDRSFNRCPLQGWST